MNYRVTLEWSRLLRCRYSAGNKSWVKDLLLDPILAPQKPRGLGTVDS